MSFQDAIMTLHRYWAEQGCLLWQPYNLQVGAGTNNPATLLRVLGPEPWRVAYVEPSVRPDDGRYAQNPNRMQSYYQYQVILKPDPGNSQELYLKSLEALGIDLRKHDVRFVEDNWESPALGAWGLGWEVWLDGQEITQFTYFQQAGGITLDIVSVEITYGLERIVLALQGKNAAWEIQWTPELTYADVFKRSEWEYSKYYFEIASVDELKRVYDTYERETKIALGAGLVQPAYDYILKCSHLFNVLDTRGAIGVTERAGYFRRMREATKSVARAFVDQRQEMEYPLDRIGKNWPVAALLPATARTTEPAPAGDFLLEIGTEELPTDDLDDALTQLNEAAPALFDALGLAHFGLTVFGTPRRLTIFAKTLAPSQPDREAIVKGPAANIAFDASGKPTKAAEGFARKNKVPVESLTAAELDGGSYVTALVKTPGQPAIDVLAKALPELIAGLKFGKTMRWNDTGIAFSRPLRWYVALIGQAIIPFEYAGVQSGNQSRGTRPAGSPDLVIRDAEDYFEKMAAQGIILSREERRARIWDEAGEIAASVGGTIIRDDKLLDEVANLVEQPTALLGTFDRKFLDLPLEVLVTVMRKHQRYFAVVDAGGKLLPHFIAVRNGGMEYLEDVVHGNEHVIVARFTDADFFFRDDRQHTLADQLPRLKTLTFQEKLGSMYDKNMRIVALVDPLARLLNLSTADVKIAKQAAPIVKADLATRMVVEMTALAGIMGREYAVREGFPQPVADAIFESNLPRSAGDRLPESGAGTLLALADKLDSLVGLFGVGLTPTATADPYGLRRAALGVVQIMLDRKLDVSLHDLVKVAAAALPVQVDESAQVKILEFIAGRLRVWLLEEEQLPFDVVDAVLSEQSVNPHRARLGARTLAEWTARADWAQTLDAYARCVRIVRKEAAQHPLDAAALTPDESKALYQAAKDQRARVDGSMEGLLNAIHALIPVITQFFDKVLVMDEDPAKRENRLALLQSIANMARGYADFSKLSGF